MALDKELAKNAEIRRIRGKLDMADAMLAAQAGATKKGANEYQKWRRRLERGIKKLKGIKGENLARFFRPGAKF